MVDRRAAGMVGWTEEDDLSEGCVVVEQIREIHRGARLFMDLDTMRKIL